VADSEGQPTGAFDAPRPDITLAVPPTPGAHVIVTPEGEVELAREITLVDATMMGVGALMGGGVFVLLGLASSVAGNGLLLALVLNGIITLPTLMVYAELGSASHDAGGGYLWVRQGLGKALGFLGGWLGWFSHVIACSLYSIASAAFIVLLVHMAGWLPGDHPELARALALGLAALFIGLNYVGVKVGIRSENVINTAVLAVVLVFIGAGLWMANQHPEVVKFNLQPFFRSGESGVGNLSGVFLAMGITFIAFEGYEIISQTSEEIQDPKRNIPRAIWYSFIIVWVIMLAVAFIALGVTTSGTGAQAWSYLGNLKELALVKMAQQVMPYGTVLVAGSALLLQLTALNATIYSSSRVSFAMGRDGNLPRIFGKVHPTRRTPHFAVLGSGVLVLIMALLPIEAVATAADVMFLLLFLLVNLAYIKLRKVIPQDRFGFRAPFFPYLPLAGIFTKFFLAIYLWKYSHVAWYVTGLWIAVGLLVYYLYASRKAQAPAPLVPAPAGAMPFAGPRRDYRVLVLISSPAPSTARALARTGGNLAKALDGEVVLLQPIVVPEVTPLAEGEAFLRDRTLLQQARSAIPAGVPVRSLVRIGHNIDAMVREAVRDEGSTLLLMSGQARATVGQPTAPLLADPPCDVGMLRLKNPSVGAMHVLVTAQSSKQAPLGVQLGTALAKGAGGVVTLYHVSQANESTAERQAWASGLLEASAVAGMKAEISLESGDPVPLVLKKSRGADLVVVGANVAPRIWRRSLLGAKTQEIADRVAGNVLLVRRVTGKRGAGGNWLGRRIVQLGRYFQPE
jgi:amino acid transporter/nucleotide-binding universal stress UspA family protein